ncbi:hypothetical protein AMS68_004724 [Peltaster fructicola]|uniref:MARVEL domain-containing protein n=1 Tax=Peltaster fructicola TaxID=286661 RepID=A0A6H0XWR4_9PEZI|nr:hypothetical protein AMS68_004724 [Peltaster fructicola]
MRISTEATGSCFLLCSLAELPHRTFITMAIARPILGLFAIILLAGGILLQFFVILSGSVYSTPENSIYFLEASTNGVSGAQNPTRWTYLALCGADSNGNNANCGSTAPAIPFNPPQNFNTNSGLPDDFVNHQNYYYYLSRFAWVFYLIALFFAVIAFLVSIIALCSRLGAYLVGSSTFLAMFFQALAASLMTAWTVQGRNAFLAAGQSADLGKYAYGFTWATFACWFLATLFFCVGGSVGKESTNTKRSYFGRKRSTRSRGSFIDNDESGRRVKDEYD